MDGLQRSAISFRRQGSSGLVWDDKFLSGKLNQTKPKDHQQADEGKRDHRASQMMLVPQSTHLLLSSLPVASVAC
ncbi:hypothetical protein CsSME_00051340 [Camellia sinensis var. sinensis]